MTLTQFFLEPQSWLSLAVGLAFIGGYWLQQRRINNLSIKLIELEDELQAINCSSIGVGKKLTQVETELKGVESELKVVESQQEEMAHRDAHQPKPYLQAAKMAQMGASVKDLMESCQLTQGEAELLVHLHQSSAA